MKIVEEYYDHISCKFNINFYDFVIKIHVKKLFNMLYVHKYFLNNNFIIICNTFTYYQMNDNNFYYVHIHYITSK